MLPIQPSEFLTAHRCPTLGGLSKIEMVLPEYVEARPHPYLNQILDTNIQFKKGARVVVLPIEKRSADFSEECVSSRTNNDFFRQTLTFSFRKTQVEISNFNRLLENRLVCVILTYQNGEKRYVKNLRFLPRNASGKKQTDKNQYQYTLTGESLHEAPFILSLPAEPQQTYSYNYMGGYGYYFGSKEVIGLFLLGDPQGFQEEEETETRTLNPNDPLGTPPTTESPITSPTTPIL